MLDAHLESAPKSAYSGSETVKLSRLDTIAKDYIKSETKSIFLKIDVQGRIGKTSARRSNRNFAFG